jgi:hypothetical protein
VHTLSKAIVGIVLGGAVAGCSNDYGPRYVERVPVAAPGAPEYRMEYERPRPMPEQSGRFDRELPPEPPFYDEPLVSQRTPEQTRFEQAYRGVGRPRITVFVNRTLEGEIVQTGDARPDYRDRRDPHRRQYDEAQARSIDYTAMENILTDFLACQGAVEIISPTVARQRLTDEQVKDLQARRPQAMREVAQQLDTDVLIHVSAQPTRQTPEGLEIRLVGEALNVKGGQQVGRTVVDIPPPMEKATLNRYTRFVARKLMADMTQNWTSADAPGARPAPAPPADRPTPESEKK